MHSRSLQWTGYRGDGPRYNETMQKSQVASDGWHLKDSESAPWCLEALELEVRVLRARALEIADGEACLSLGTSEAGGEKTGSHHMLFVAC